MVSYKSYSMVGVLTILGCGACLLLLGADTQERDRERQLNLAELQLGIVEKLVTGAGTEIGAARDELIGARKRVIGELVNIVAQRENRVRKRSTVRSAMRVLGEMRAVEAIEVLVEHIGFPETSEAPLQPVVVTGGRIAPGLADVDRAYPAVGALRKIGEPCFDAVVAKLATTDSYTDERACLGVLVGLRDREYILYMLDKAVQKEKDPKKMENLQRAMERLTPKKKEAKEESAKPEP